MSKEFTPISIDDFAAFPAEDFVWAEVQATSPSTGYGYQYRFHTHGTGNGKNAMELTPASAVRVIEGLGELSLLEAPLVTHLYTRQEAEALEASFREDGIS